MPFVNNDPPPGWLSLSSKLQIKTKNWKLEMGEHPSGFTYTKLVRENSIIRLRRELPWELWWFNGVEFTINESGDLPIVRLLGESSKSIWEWSKRRNESSDVGWMATLGAVGVEVVAMFNGWFGVLSRFNLNIDNIDINKLMIKTLTMYHRFNNDRAHFFYRN